MYKSGKPKRHNSSASSSRPPLSSPTPSHERVIYMPRHAAGCLSPHSRSSSEKEKRKSMGTKSPISPTDPYLVVNPSFDRSVLLRDGAVQPTARPPPAHQAHDLQPPSRDATLTLGSGQGLGFMLPSADDTPRKTDWQASLGRRNEDRPRSRWELTEHRSDSAAPSVEDPSPVTPPPPTYTRYPVGQGKGRANPYDGA
ncbi:hypothetical protein BV25DRAFT_1832072 [Artomyces pyxidatus]|uniref:Uncharacterized protein n=1 Tax=Artomyces pyxidatus TaxID=48021 RepID=A0ACB8SKC4_9AGAM|nr:hypothetical protein BV25DRAFT_1832072 [Artomyces pyxidatus]